MFAIPLKLNKHGIGELKGGLKKMSRFFFFYYSGPVKATVIVYTFIIRILNILCQFLSETLQ